MENKRKKVVIIGGGAAGTTCAFHLRKINKELAIEIIEKSNYFNYSPCALPYVLAGEIAQVEDIHIFKQDDYMDNDIVISLNSEVKHIAREEKTIELNDGRKIDYDFLVIATGAEAIKIKKDLLSFQTITDLLLLQEKLRSKEEVIILGAGLIGCEIAMALRRLNKKVRLVEIKDYILPGLLDKKAASEVLEYLIDQGVKVETGQEIQDIKDDDLIIATCGFMATTDLARQVGLDIDKGLLVNEYLQTSDPYIYSAGDMIQFFNNFTGQKEVGGFGSLAVGQANIVAENINGAKKKYWGTVNPFVSKIGDLFIGGAGMNKEEALRYGIDCLSVSYKGSLMATYYSAQDKIFYQLSADKKGLLKGGRIISRKNIAGRVNTLALALKKEMTVAELAENETCYNPAVAPIFDPQTITAQMLLRRLNL